MKGLVPTVSKQVNPVSVLRQWTQQPWHQRQGGEAERQDEGTAWLQ